MPKQSISPRAKRVWQRLVEWYGTRLIEQYGEAPPEDWCRCIDSIDNDEVKHGLSLIRTRYIQHPPTLPQFEQAMRREVASSGPSPAERLCDHVTLHYGRRLSAKQLRGPWTYIGSETGAISGVVIGADGDYCGYRVMLADLNAPDLAPQPPPLRLVKA